MRKTVTSCCKYSPVTVLPDLTAGSPGPGLALPLQQGLVWAERTSLTCQQRPQMSYAQMRLQQRASPHKPVWSGRPRKWNHTPQSVGTVPTGCWGAVLDGEHSLNELLVRIKPQPFSRKEWNKNLEQVCVCFLKHLSPLEQRHIFGVTAIPSDRRQEALKRCLLAVLAPALLCWASVGKSGAYLSPS